MGWICVDDRSRDGEESCSVEDCRGSLGGLVGGGGGADGVSNIMAEYFVDLKRMRLSVISTLIMVALKLLIEF